MTKLQKFNKMETVVSKRSRNVETTLHGIRDLRDQGHGMRKLVRLAYYMLRISLRWE
jgi:hypothetical protein